MLGPQEKIEEIARANNSASEGCEIVDILEQDERRAEFAQLLASAVV